MISLKKNKISVAYPIIAITIVLLLIVPITYRAYAEYKFYQLDKFLEDKTEDNSPLHISEITQYLSYNGYTMNVNYHNVKDIPNPKKLPITIFDYEIIAEDSVNTIIIRQSLNETQFAQDLVLEINTGLLLEFTTFLVVVIAIVGSAFVIIFLFIYRYTNKKYIVPIHKLSKTLVDLKRVTVEDPNNISEIESVIKTLNKKVDNYLSYRNNIITIITHELKSPLNIINSAMLSRKYNIEPFDNEEEVYKEIDIQIKYMLDVIDITLNIFELEEYEMTEFQAQTEIENVLAGFLKIFAANDIKINTSFQEDFMIYGNPRIFKIVINNLLNNTAKYGSNHLKITIDHDTIAFINTYNNSNEHGTQLGLKLSSQILKTMKLTLKHEYKGNEFIAQIKKKS